MRSAACAGAAEVGIASTRPNTTATSLCLSEITALRTTLSELRGLASFAQATESTRTLPRPVCCEIGSVRAGCPGAFDAIGWLGRGT